MEDIVARLKQKISSYRPSESTCDLVRATPKLFLVGISGAGKDTIMRHLLKTGKYYAIVSHTTRAPRANDGVPERDGVEYNFIDLAQAGQMLDDGRYIEANVYGSNIYGTSVSELQKAHDLHKVAITDIEVQGVAAYMNIDPHTRAVFILPPSYEVWQERLERRHGGAISRAELEERFEAARRELEHALDVPYFHFVVNDVLDDAVDEIEALVSGEEDTKSATHAKRIAQDILERLNEVTSKVPAGRS